MGHKYGISYCVLISYVVVVFLISVVIAVTVSLIGVKRTNCDDDKTTVEYKNENSNNYKMEKSRRYDRKHFKRMDRDAACDAMFSVNMSGTLWESDRLPTNVIPTRYEIQLTTLNVSDASYKGHVNINLTLTENVNTIILHAHLIEISSPVIRDSSNNQINIQCAGIYSTNEYYVIRTTSMIARTQAPLTLSLDFSGYLDLYETGFFKIQYLQGGLEFDGYF